MSSRLPSPPPRGSPSSVDADPDLDTRAALLLVSVAWVAASVFGAVPFLLAGYGTESTVGLDLRFGAPPDAFLGALFTSLVNALFESTSGVTTTGATVLGEISFERHSHAVLMWRQLIQWLGGMGIVVLMIAILPELAVNGAQLMESEAPGPELQRLTPKIAETARALWLIYFGFTLLYVCLLYGLHLTGHAPNMDLYNAVAHGLTTLPTGGFSPQADSIWAFSAAIQWLVIPFMVVAGVNFALFWHVVRGDPRRLIENTEFRTYVGALAVTTAVLAALLFLGAAPRTAIGGATEGLTERAVRHAAPDRLASDLDGVRERELRGVGYERAGRPAVRDVHRRVGRLDRRGDQGRPLGRGIQGGPPGAVHHGQPRRRAAGPARGIGRRRGRDPRDHELHAALSPAFRRFRGLHRRRHRPDRDHPDPHGGRQRLACDHREHRSGVRPSRPLRQLSVLLRGL